MKAQTEKDTQEAAKAQQHHSQGGTERQTIAALLGFIGVETAICTLEGNPAPPPREGGLETGLVLGAPTPVRGGGASSGDHPACGAQAACKLVHHHAVGWGRRPRLHTLDFVPVFPTEG